MAGVVSHIAVCNTDRVLTYLTVENHFLGGRHEPPLGSIVSICNNGNCVILRWTGKAGRESQPASDVKMSDHDKIEKLMDEVAELQKKLDGLTQRYNAHTHQLRNLHSAPMPSSIECDQTVFQWAPAGMISGSVDKVCRQLVSGNIGVLVLGKEPAVTSPPR